MSNQTKPRENNSKNQEEEGAARRPNTQVIEVPQTMAEKVGEDH